MNDEQFFLAVLIVMSATAAAIVTAIALVIHRNFLSIACDTAAFQNAMVNTLHGSWFRDTAYNGPNLLGVHTSFVLLLLLPIYALAPSADTLFILQIWMVYSTLIPVYLIAQKLIQRPYMSFCVGALTLASPFLLHQALAPFHPETWIAAAVLWSYYFYRCSHRIGFCASMLFAVCCAEQAALIYIALGVSLLLIDDGVAGRKWCGAVALGGGIIWTLLAVVVVGPLARGPHGFDIFAYNYSEWGVSSAAGLPMAIARHPMEALRMVTNPLRLAYLATIIGLPLLLALTSWRSLILLAPFPFYFLMNSGEFFLSFHAYYFAFAFVAGCLGLIFFLARRESSNRWSIAVLAGTFFASVVLLCNAADIYAEAASCRDDDFSASLHEIFDSIPATATVYTAHRYSAYLSNRQNMVIGDVQGENLDFDAMMNARFNETDVRPGQVDYIVCDLICDQCGCRSAGYDADRTRIRKQNVERLLQSGQWENFWTQRDVVILRRTGK